jgi:hypothetical protein
MIASLSLDAPRVQDCRVFLRQRDTLKFPVEDSMACGVGVKIACPHSARKSSRRCIQEINFLSQFRRSLSMVARSTAVFAFVVSLWSTAGNAVVFTYTDESEYLAKLSTLGYGQWSENFEGAAWDGLRTTRDIGAHPTYHTAAAATSRGITWEGPSYQSPITTEQRFHFLPGEDSASYAANKWALTAVTRRADLDTFKGTSANMLYGVGGWFDSMSGYKYDEDSQSYLPKGHMFVSLDGGLT